MGMFQNWLEKRELRGPHLSENGKPDYSLDRWIKMTKDLGDNVHSMVGDAKEKDKDIDGKLEKKKKDDEVEDEKKTPGLNKDNGKQEEEEWNHFKSQVKKVKEKLGKDSKKQEKSS